jgi:hypothetical protein
LLAQLKISAGRNDTEESHSGRCSADRDRRGTAT